MSKTPIIIGVIVLLLVIVGVAVYFKMMKDEEPSLGPSAGPSTGPAVALVVAPAPIKTEEGFPNGRFVKVIQTVADRALILRELEVYDKNDVNVALNKPVVSNPDHGIQAYGSLTDGIIEHDTYARTRGDVIPGEDFDYFMVDLGALTGIKNVIIRNRGTNNANKDRLKGTKVVILGEDGLTVIAETTVVTSRQTDANFTTFTFPSDEEA
jgi:hypothetical protein